MKTKLVLSLLLLATAVAFTSCTDKEEGNPITLTPDFVNAPPKSLVEFLRLEKWLDSLMFFCEA